MPLHDIIDIVLEARPAAISFEAANPRHEHEWTVFEDLKLPEGKALIPGVLDSPPTTSSTPSSSRSDSSAMHSSSAART
jgi:methionine synthase II (cobalamin-independent)